MGEFCEPTLNRCLPQFDPVECIVPPVLGSFETTAEISITESTRRPDCLHAIAAPTVIDLDADGIPEIISNMACDEDWTVGVVRVNRGDTGEELWVSEVETYGRISTGAIVLADGSVRIVTISSPRSPDGARAVAFNADGSLAWYSTDEAGAPLTVSGNNGAPSFADLDGDGVSEIVFGALALDASGRRIWQRNAGGAEGASSLYSGGLSAIADIDLDGLPDVVSGRRAYERDGTPKWTASVDDGYPAIAQFDDDPQPEVALVADGQVFLLDGLDGSVQWGPIDIPGDGLGGPPTIADFDGDSRPEIGVAGGRSYSVYDPDGMVPVLWSQPTVDLSSNATGSSVFDFEGDGIAEVVYQDECMMRVYRGTDGMVLLEIENSSATIHEYPLVVDVDADGNSEIIIVANNRTPSILSSCRSNHAGWDGGRSGVFVYGDSRDQWVGTRRVWNQHAYHVTNVTSASSLPATELNNWEVPGLNNYRQNVQGEGVFNAPDLQAGLEVSLAGCPERVTLRARVSNLGSLGVLPGVPVSFYDGAPGTGGALLGTASTTVPLLPGASSIVELPVSLSGEAPFSFHAIVDRDGSTDGDIAECNEDNNTGFLSDVDCGLLI
jgi:hypothetical protein